MYFKVENTADQKLEKRKNRQVQWTVVNLHLNLLRQSVIARILIYVESNVRNQRLSIKF